MASIELLTGHQNANHITSDDGRSMNRAIFGKGAYRLMGEYNSTTGGTKICSVGTQTSGTNKKPYINQGLLYWNGMFIRINNAIAHSAYVAIDGWKIYLHYTRETDTEIENVAVVFTDAEYTSTPDFAYDNDHRDVYLLYGTFNSAAIFTYSLQLKEPTFDQLTFSRNDLVNMFTTRDTSTQKTLLASVQLTNSTDGTDAANFSYSDYFEKIENFAFVEIRIKSSGGSYYHIKMLPVEAYTDYNAADNCWRKRWSNNLNDFYFSGYVTAGSSSGSRFAYKKLIKYVNGTFTAETNTYTVEIYGVGRLAT